MLEATQLGIALQGIDSKLNMLLYADDLAVIAESEEDLQRLLEVLASWCGDMMTINMDKTKVIHYKF